MSISYAENFFKKMDPTSAEDSPGIVIPDGQKVMVTRIRASGYGESFVTIFWDKGGQDEKILATTNGSVDQFFSTSTKNPTMIFTGNGAKKIQISIENNGESQTPYVGGAVEIDEVP